MAEEEEIEDEEPKKGSKKPLLIGLILALVLGGGGFFAVYSGMLLAPEPVSEEEMVEEIQPEVNIPEVAFIALDPLIINTGSNGARHHLRFHAQLEVTPAYLPEVEVMQPRIVDILNGYLRAVEIRDLEDPMALIRLRAQMLRRIQVITGEGRVRDLLIMEFVLN